LIKLEAQFFQTGDASQSASSQLAISSTLLFNKTKELHGRIDHVFANAGIGPRADYLSSQLDQNGNLMEPSSQNLDTNLKGVINTSTLAIHHLRQQKEGGSIVSTGSTTGLQ
jgi:NAD(P)-dependent dehydrogenase (short-subunit alcohol dehydrogenase family)